MSDAPKKVDLAKTFGLDITTTKGWRKLKLLEERNDTRREQLVHFRLYLQEIKGLGRQRYINCFLDQPTADDQVSCFIHLFVRAWKEIQDILYREHANIRTVACLRSDGKKFTAVKFPWREIVASKEGQAMFDEFELSDMPNHPSLDYWPQPL